MEKEKGENTKSLFRIALEERFLTLGSGRQVTCKHIDNVGLFIYHDGTQELTPEFVRHHLIARRESNCLIEASSPEEAIKIFHTKWEGTKIGGPDRKSKALWINERVPIDGLPKCELLHKNRYGEYICGEEVPGTGHGEFGMCVIENYDAPDDCIIEDFYTEYFNRKAVEALPVKTVNVDGVDYPFVMAEDLFATKTPQEP